MPAIILLPKSTRQSRRRKGKTKEIWREVLHRLYSVATFRDANDVQLYCGKAGIRYAVILFLGYVIYLLVFKISTTDIFGCPNSASVSTL